MNIKIEYGPIVVKHIAVQCPKCKKWFRGQDVAIDDIKYKHQVEYARFKCPLCEISFGGDEYNDYIDLHIEEATYSDIYKDCLTKKEVWT